jgi:hypothetical protein
MEKRSMTAEENKTIARRFEEEVFGQGNLQVVDELLTSDYVSHAPETPNKRAEWRALSKSSKRTSQRFPTSPTPWRSKSPKGTWWSLGGGPVGLIKASSWASLLQATLSRLVG